MDTGKYYTPELESFHVGFEFEILNDSGQYEFMTFGNTITHSELEQYADDLVKIAHAITRVKHLDREDIESLRWVETVISGVSGNWHIGSVTTQYETLQYNFDTKKMSISHSEDGNNYTRFNGVIKNKSELAKLMKQIGI